MAKIQLRPGAKKSGSKSPTSASRRALTAKDQAMPGGRYPIPNIDFLKRAIRSIGRTPAAQRPSVIAWIKKRAKALGATNLVANLSSLESAIELSGQIATPPHLVPGARTKLTGKGAVPAIPDKGSGASKMPVKSKPSNGPLKTAKGQAVFARLCKKGLPRSMALKAAKKAEQGMEADLSNQTGAIELAKGKVPPQFQAHQFKAKGTAKVPAGDTPGKKDADGDFDGDTTADVAAKQKLGLQNKQALACYRKCIAKGLKPAVALQAAKKLDQKLGNPHTRAKTEMASSPKA
jgi:hypothetical protein